MSRFLVGLAVLLAGCASHEQSAAPIRLPTNQEVSAYVTQHWTDFSERAATFAARGDERPSLKSVRNTDCWHPYGISVFAECSFQVTVQFQDGQSREQELASRFERDPAGGFREVFVIIDEMLRR